MNMNKYCISLFIFCFVLFPIKSKAWRLEGYTIIVYIIMELLKPYVKKNMLAMLDTVPINMAAIVNDSFIIKYISIKSKTN